MPLTKDNSKNIEQMAPLTRGAKRSRRSFRQIPIFALYGA